MARHTHTAVDPENGVYSEFDALELEYDTFTFDEVNELFDLGEFGGIDSDE